ncbi:DUF4167 domain-containing protein [Cereibacter sphaeroides]|uniref:DUF4167 domain-containing protein n=1 Tax=Cereibacter sphaeroides TaxID=1063 RepID=UPI001F22C6E3|nr:DUF4167 domain-containing protein [Cereibacter sphaeroides]MCE6952844.1 DUF4167 domain-containing protein [Cereibacter sphaeroides]
MRSSKSRSRSKSNRPRSLGNIVNRVFDSSGPEGKVRGTPAQIIEKYLFLARDAQLSNDRVAAENFLQHAEHYTRLLGEAQREMALEQENRRSEHQPGQGGQPQQQGNHRNDRPREDRRDERQDQPRAEREPRPEAQPQPQPQPVQEAPASSHEVIDLSDAADEETGLVETPEARHRHRPAPRRRHDTAAAPQSDPQPAGDAPAATSPEAAPAEGASAEAASEQAKPDRPRRPRGPRKPKPRDDDGSPDDSGPREAAE